LKDNKIKVIEKELKDVNQYDEQKINDLLNRNPVIRNINRERVKRRLRETLSLTYKLFHRNFLMIQTNNLNYQRLEIKSCEFVFIYY
jgi:hypothetical protein